MKVRCVGDEGEEEKKKEKKHRPQARPSILYSPSFWAWDAMISVVGHVSHGLLERLIPLFWTI